MKRIILLAILIPLFALMAKAQPSKQAFDTVRFNEQLEIANHLIEYEFYTKLAVDKFSKLPETSGSEWFSYQENNTWHSVGRNRAGNTFAITNHVVFDSLYAISDFTGITDTTKLNASGSALSMANTRFQIIQDTSNIYFSSFVICNPDLTISIWYLPAFQPSGQAIYGCEWEYIFDNTGKNFLRQNSYARNITGVWIGQPRELWLNYRSTDEPTTGSVFFAQSFRDYFKRIRIDTRISTSTTSKDANGKYSWTHKMK